MSVVEGQKGTGSASARVGVGIAALVAWRGLRCDFVTYRRVDLGGRDVSYVDFNIKTRVI